MNTEKDDIYKVDIGTFGDYLKEEWLEPLDMTADSLAKSIGISAAAMSKILSGKNRMSDETGLRLAHFFGVSKGYFLRIQAQYTERQQEAYSTDEQRSYQSSTGLHIKVISCPDQMYKKEEYKMEEPKKENRGGRREGAGRPKGIKKPYKAVNTRMPAEYADRLRILSERNSISICQILKDYVDKNWKE